MGMKVNGTTGLTFPDTTTLASAGQASVRAWVNFNGTGTVAIRASYNVTSITDNGTGDYTVNFTTAMPDVNYAALLSSEMGAGNGGFNGVITPTTSTLRFSAYTNAGALRDISLAYVAIFR